jgi:putative nucleotidyltransferase with HDIG domain
MALQDKNNSTRITTTTADAIEMVFMKGMELSLLSAGDGTEVIHHKIDAGHHWALQPETGWTSLEFFYMLSGKMKWKKDDGTVQYLTAGQSFSAQPVIEPAIFYTIEDTEFIYVSSQPVFHHYSKHVRDTFDLAVAVEEKDGYTSDHCQRIMKFSMMIAEEMNLNTKDLVVLNLAAFLHDVGKINVPDHILRKPGKLTTDEWESMKQHPIYGYELLNKTQLPLLEEAARIVLQHHERFDGKGYPHGLKQSEIDIRSAIISVVDSFDAMTTDRVYRKGCTKEEAIDEIKKLSGTMYHPKVVDTFLSIANKLN